MFYCEQNLPESGPATAAGAACSSPWSARACAASPSPPCSTCISKAPASGCPPPRSSSLSVRWPIVLGRTFLSCFYYKN